jgi:Na+-translocating ferredoxin:NAD+ oxidoreductase RNF subunit RnfB
MNENAYQRLAEHLDRLPGGFAPSETGAELRLLERLFTPAEAQLAVHLTLDQEEADVIAKRAELPIEDVAKRLRDMSHKGLILSVIGEDSPPLYQAVPWVVGIYEFQVNRMNPGLVQDLSAYYSTLKQRPRARTIPQMRTIPIGQSIESDMNVLPHENIASLLQDHDRFAVAPCICRRHAEMRGEGCGALEEACLMFGEWADYYVRDKRGRSIDRNEAMDILAQADAANLVLQPTHSKRISAICCCCSCCCGMLRGLHAFPKPAEIVTNAFITQFNSEVCADCLTCIDRCQMGAFSEEDGSVEYNKDRCIGCGLCVSTCPSGALNLVRKDDYREPQMPDTMFDTWRTISQMQRQG